VGVGVGVSVETVVPPLAALFPGFLSLPTLMIQTPMTTISTTVPTIDAMRVKRRRATSRSGVR